MYWQKRFDREDPDQELKDQLLSIREKHKDYVYRRIQKELARQGQIVNHKKIQRLMRELGICVTSFTRKSRKYSSYKGKVGHIASNRLKRRFMTSIPYQKITTDTTELKYYETNTSGQLQIKKIYLDSFMDLFNQEIVSYKITKQPNGESIMEALQEAIEETVCCPYRRTFHSDQGWAYQMRAYSHELRKHKIFQSMSRRGNCLDNSPLENFFGILKQEMYYGKVFKSYEDLKMAVELYISYYNRERMKERLNWLSPVEYRQLYSTLNKTA